MTSYHITTLYDSAGHRLTPNSINDVGVITGLSQDGQDSAFIENTHTGVISDIDGSTGLSSTPFDINNAGQVVGYGFDHYPNIQGFVYDSTTGVRTTLNLINSSLTAINDSGLAIGSSDSGQGDQGLIDDTRTGTITGISVPGGTRAVPIALNEAGDVAGDFNDAAGHLQGFVRYANGTLETISVPGASDTLVSGINDKGQVAGVFDRDHARHLYVEDLTTKTFQTFDAPDAGFVEIGNINNNGVVLGDVFTTNYHGFTYDTKTRIASTFDVPGASTTHPYQINDNGQIVGTFNTNTVYGFLADPNTDPPCYCPGTLIETALGERPVEQLAIGDILLTASGHCRPVKWVGYTLYDARSIAGSADVLPVCIKAGALGPGVPRRDLWVSPGHAMLVDGALVHARMLINGVSIVQAEAVDALSYVHVELEDHDIILAEGATAESFLDNGCRKQFANAADFQQRYPDFVPGPPCMPLLEGGFALQAIRDRIDARAGLRPEGVRDPGPLRGFVDAIGPDTIRGWAQDGTRPEEAVRLDVLVNGAPMLQVVANRSRGDLVKAGLGSGRHGFEARVPGGIRGRVEVRRSKDQALVAMTAAARLTAASL